MFYVVLEIMLSSTGKSLYYHRCVDSDEVVLNRTVICDEKLIIYDHRKLSTQRVKLWEQTQWVSLQKIVGNGFAAQSRSYPHIFFDSDATITGVMMRVRLTKK